MDFNVLMNWLDDNQVKVHPRFQKAYTKDKCIGDYLPLSEEIIGEMERCVCWAVNHDAGFSRPVRETLEGLSKLWVRISKQNNGAMREMFARSVEAVWSEFCKKTKSESKETYVMKEQLINRIEAYRDGLSVLLEQSMAEDRKPILSACAEKLEHLKQQIADVTDATSQNALQHAEKVTALLVKWADVVVHAMHNAQTPAMLDEAQKEVTAWATEHVEKKKLKPCKSIDSVRFEGNDMLSNYGASRRYVEDANHFQSNLRDYKANVFAAYNVEQQDEIIRQQEEALAQLEQERKETYAKYQNGEISEAAANEIGLDLEERRIEYEQTKQDAEEERREINGILSEFKSVFATLDKLAAVIAVYKDVDPDTVVFIGQYMQFDALFDVMRGRADINAIQSLQVLERASTLVKEHMRGNLRQFRDTMRRQREEELQNRPGRQRLATQQANAQPDRRGLDFLRGAAADKQQQPKEEQKNSVGNDFEP